MDKGWKDTANYNEHFWNINDKSNYNVMGWKGYKNPLNISSNFKSSTTKTPKIIFWWLMQPIINDYRNLVGITLKIYVVVNLALLKILILN